MLSSQVSLVFEGLSARGRSTMHVGPCSPLANEEKSSQEDRAEVFMLTSYTSHTSLLPCLFQILFAKGDINGWPGYHLSRTNAGWS